MNKGEIILYQPDDAVAVEVRLEKENVWLNRQQIAVLFDRDIKTIGKHINNALKEELAEFSTVANFATVGGDSAENSVVAKFATTAADGNLSVYSKLRFVGLWILLIIIMLMRFCF